MSIMFCERHSVEYDSDYKEMCPYCKEEYDEDNAYDLDKELNRIFDETTK